MRSTTMPAGVGSIPACAGEPGEDGDDAAVKQVYPRVCGGTAAGGGYYAYTQGLSPRVRGNHALDHHQCPYQRSIPACAGEPRRLR